MSMQGSAMMYVTAASLATERSGRGAVSSATISRHALRQRRLDDHLVETGGVRALEPGLVGVVREADDRDVRPRVDDLLRLDARDVDDDEVGRVDAVGRDEVVAVQESLELPPEEEIDPCEQDRRHGRESISARSAFLPGDPERLEEPVQVDAEAPELARRRGARPSATMIRPLTNWIAT